MDDERFWTVVASLGPNLIPARLEMVLSSLSRAEAREFWSYCEDVGTEALDTQAHRHHSHTAYEQAGVPGTQREWSTPTVRVPAVLRDLQLTIVAMGRDTWRAVVAVPGLLSGDWPTGLGRQLALAASTAAGPRLA